ncbi:MAG: AMP-binding protein [Pseudomonadota bacterium]|nr:MAG: AMP-binding protein [Pseudomonadota bacterium]
MNTSTSTQHTVSGAPQPNAVNQRRATEQLLRDVQALVQDLHPRRAPPTVTLDSSIDRDLGLDSLARVELLARLEERFEVSLPERVFAEAETLRDLLRAVASARGRTRVPQMGEALDIEAPGEGRVAPDTARTLIDVLQWHAQHNPDRSHIRVIGEETDEGATVSSLGCQALLQGAQQVAAGLQHRGTEPGEAIAIMLPTSEAYFLSFFGILLAGAIPVPIYPPVRASQLEDHLRRHQGILRNCGATLLITVPEARTVARLLRSQVETLRDVVTVEELAGTGNTYNAPPIGAQDVAFLQYTSGSTGNPKGVVLTHANLLANVRAMGEAVQASPSDVFVSWLPLYHDMGLIGAWFGSLYYGIPLAVMSPLSFLTRPARWLWAIHQHRGTLSAAPNFAYELCMKRVSADQLEGLDLSYWRLAFNGAEPVSPSTVQRFGRWLEPYGLRPEAMMPVYGLAESSVGLAFPPLDRGPLIDCVNRETFARDGRAVPVPGSDPNALCFVACGQALPGCEVRVVGAAERELPDREQGLVEFRGPSATSGYYHNPEATRGLFRGDWLDTGDLGYMVDGDVFITGRTKDIIIRGGRNIFPHELEEAVGNVTGVRKGCVAAFGSADPRDHTERLIVLAETRERDQAARQSMRKNITAVTVELTGSPADEVVLAPPHTVLKTSSGKIRRAASRQLFEEGRLELGHRAVWLQIVRVAGSAVRPALRRARNRIASYAYATWVRAIFFPLATTGWLLAWLLPRLTWRWSALRRLARLFLRAAGIPVTVHGMENLPGPEQPRVIVANHGSYLDGLVLTALLPHPHAYVAKSELAEQFIAGTFLRRMHARFVERFDAAAGVRDARAIARAGRAGQSVIFFPEGTLQRTAGLLPFHMGAFVAAAEANIPLVPVALRGTRSILRGQVWFPHRGAITVTIAPGLDPAAGKLAAQDEWASALALRDYARCQILRHSGEPDLEQRAPRDKPATPQAL